MASGRRGVAQQQQEAIVENNPELARSTTTLEVDQSGKKRPEIEATNDGEDVRVGLSGREKAPPFVTIADAARVPDGRLSTTSTDENEEEWGPETKLILSKDGFGVTSRNDEEEDQRSRSDPRDQTIEEGEALTLSLRGGPKPPQEPNKEDGPEMDIDFLEFGGVSLMIDYEVISGSGDVVVTLIDRDAERDDGRITTFEDVVGSRRDTEGSIEAELEDGHFFDRAEITVEGDLEIIVTGIQYTTNFGDDLLNI